MPNKIRGNTLGSYLKETGAREDDPINEVDAARTAFNPGFPATTDLATAEEADHSARADLLDPSQTGVQDLSYKHLQSFSHYARSLTSGHNRFYPNPEAFAGGLQTSDINPNNAPNSFLPSNQTPANASPFIKAYFDNITLGGSAATRGGGFFNQEVWTEVSENTSAEGSLTAFIRQKYLLYLGASTNLLGEAVESVIHSTNMYSPRADGSPYIKYSPGGANNASDADDFYNKGGLWSVQTGGADALGKFDKDAPHVTVAQIRGMALKMLLDASGESANANLIGLEKEGLTESILKAYEEAMTNATNGVQIGISDVNVSDLSLRSQIEGSESIESALGRLKNSAGNENFIAGVSKSDITSNHGIDNSKTIGSLNNPGEYFGGALPIGMLMTVLIGLLSFVLISILIEALLAGPSKKELAEQKPSTSKPWTLKAGSPESRTAPGGGILNLFMKLFGLPTIQSDSNFASAFFRGIQRFYGFGFDMSKASTTPTPILLVELLESMINIALAPGFYAVMQRVIMRDLSKISDAFGDIGGAGSGGGAMTAMQVFKAVETLLTSSTFRFVIVCIGLGDKGYDALYSPGRAHTGMPNGVPSYKNEAEVQHLTPLTRMYLSRFHGDNAKDVKSPLSLVNFSSLILNTSTNPKDLPENIEMLGKQDALTRMTTEHTSIATAVMSEKQGRFSADIVATYEEALDYEYVPFYFHDLRTNEIIAIPAFVTSINESFAPGYSETQAYGRTDPIYGYSNTKRSIDIGFKIAAMNPKDFDYMWFVIEKLIAMCYPQRSVGKIRSIGGATESGRFIQPFSQVPTASPVIRVRLGELLHSNFSSSRLQALFGEGTPHLNLTSKETPSDAAYWDKLKKQQFNIHTARRFVIAAKLKEFTEGNAAVDTCIYTLGYGTPLIIDGRKEQSGLGGLASAIPGVGDSDGISVRTSRGTIPFTILGKKGGEAGQNDDNKGGAPAAKDKTPAQEYYEVELDFSKRYTSESAQKKYVAAQFPKVKSVKDTDTKIKCLIPIGAVEDIKMPLQTASGEKQPTDFNNLVTGRMDDRTNNEEGAISQEELTKREDFFSPIRNAIVKSFESASGHGQAGVITNMSLNYDNSVWGTGNEGESRKPKSVDITLSFAPIHDLPLGLNQEGAIIAPTHGSRRIDLDAGNISIDGETPVIADLPIRKDD